MSKDGRYSSEELKQMQSETDWDAVRKTTDEEIDAACSRDPVWQEEMGGDEWTEQIDLVRPAKKAIYAKFDADIIEFYQSFGRGYQARMNAVLRAYMEAHRQDSA
ncbi:MAG: BrnA antitoxin family protein [Candidatus Tectomicrobia bacterium]|nr:BrnA antitoxin family protein [Candidatus Tectomicrobia bacterium]